jgi:rhodanese-related sulfurtransferase
MRKKFVMIASVGKIVSLGFYKAGSTLRCDANRQFAAPLLTWVDYLLIIGLSVLCALVFNGSNFKGIPIVPQSLMGEAVSFESPSMAFDKYKKGETLFVDAMPHSFYEQEHIAGAVSLPMELFVFMYDMSIGQTDKSKEIIVYGRTISKRYDEEVASNLVARGHKNVKILKGGLETWRKKHYPVET